MKYPYYAYDPQVAPDGKTITMVILNDSSLNIMTIDSAGEPIVVIEDALAHSW